MIGGLNMLIQGYMIVFRRFVALLTGRASEHLTDGVRPQEKVPKGRIRDSLGQALHERLRAPERLPSGGWAIAGCEQPSKRDMIPPFDQWHGVLCKGIE
jgi:hypothetical protein